MMKPIPKPSLVMLWIARFYALFALSFSSLRFFSVSQQQDTVMTNQSPAPAGMTGSSTTIVMHYSTTPLLVSILLLSCLALGLFTLHRKMGRGLTLTAAVSSIGYNLYGATFLFYMVLLSKAPNSSLHLALLGQFLVSSACHIVIQLGNIWLALFPPFPDRPEEGHLPPFIPARII